KPEGWAGNDRGGGAKFALRALDYKTGKLKWEHVWPSGSARSGILTTAGGVLFTGDTVSSLVAFNATTGNILWHAGLGNPVTNGPITYTLDGQQYLAVARRLDGRATRSGIVHTLVCANFVQNWMLAAHGKLGVGQNMQRSNLC
ncbi:hypothetical protein MMC31_003283, partial [Peltigera leucophlebia]|nr:hypothetical protein [Peltigera leucophlebia]